MKKKLLLIIIAIIFSSQNIYAETDNTSASENGNSTLISIWDNDKKQDTKTQKRHFPIIHSRKIPTLDTVDKLLDNASEQNRQIDSAKSISERINNSLNNNNAIKIDINTVNQIVNVDDCVKIALANHPSIQYYKSSAEIYKSKIAQAWSAYFPTIGAGIEYSRNDLLLTTFNTGKQRYNLFYMPNLS